MLSSSPKIMRTLKVKFTMGFVIVSYLSLVQPVHLAFALLSEDPGTLSSGSGTGITLFASVISRVGGDPVGNFILSE